MRLRQGSSGPRVRLLETALGLTATGVYSHKVVKALVSKQRQALNFNDGVYSPEMEQRLGFQVFSAEIEPVIASAQTLESAGAGGPSEEDFLLQEIGLRAKLAEIEPQSLTADVIIAESVLLESTFGDLKALGFRVFQRVEHSLHAMVCGDNPADAPDRERFAAMLNDAAARGSDAAKEALQWLLTAALLLPPRLAEPIAGLIVKRVIEPAAGELIGAAMPTVENTCRSWALRLRETAAMAPART
ncbi:MAG: hypothetical protein HC850_16340 [Rhodomicrobium sp.]|nr:hypothetical protein [Rhodomicrobium sp.]